MQEITRLENGLTVVSVAMPQAASVCVGIWVAVGSRHESAVNNGAAHFIEHMLFKGTETRNPKQIVAEVEGLGGYLNAYTSEDHTCYYARARADKWRSLVDVLWDMYANATMPRAEINREREVIKEERAMYLDDPHHLTQEILGRAMWPDHPLGRPIEGSDESLDRLGRKELREFLRTNYQAENTFVVASGRLDHRRLVALVGRLGKKMDRGVPPAFERARSAQTAPRVEIEHRDIDQTQVALGIRTCDRADKRRYGVRMLSALLAENMSSRLYQVLREQHGLAYSVCSTPNSFEDAGDITITAGVDSERLPRALELLQRELKRIRTRAPGERELRQARDYVLGQFDIYLESNENYMTWLGECVVAHGDIVAPSLVKRRISRVTAREIRQAAHDFIRPENMTMAVVTPRKRDRRLVKYLTV
jgi:predicted Zn-dependent peptidase